MASSLTQSWFSYLGVGSNCMTLGKLMEVFQNLTVLLQQQHQFHCGYTTEMFCKHLSDILNGDEIHAYELITAETSFFQFSYLKMQYRCNTFI